MKICVLAANPSETERINLEQELGQIRDAVERGAMRDRLKILPVPRCRVSELQHILDSERPDIVHFSGHGTESHGEIVLYDDHDLSVPVQIDALAHMLHETTGVVLNSCSSEHQAKLVAKKGPWAIGMAGRLPNPDACSFSHAFYGRLADGRTVAEAFEGAKDRLSAEHRSSASLPVFFPGRGFPVPEAERRMPWIARMRRWFARPVILFVIVAALLPAALIVDRARGAREVRERAGALREEGWQALKRLDTKEAVTQLQFAMDLAPDAAISHAALAVAFAERGNYDQAKPESERAVAQKGVLGAREQLWIDGVAAEMRWDLPTAIKLYREGWQGHQDREAALRMAHVQTLSGDTAAANGTLDELERAPDYDDARIDLERANASRASAPDDRRKLLLEIRNRHIQHPRVGAATLWMECGTLANEEDKRVEAVAVCENAWNQFAGSSKTEDALGRARIKSIQALLFAAGFGVDSHADRTQQLNKAIESATEALKIAHDQRSQIDEAGALQNLAIVEDAVELSAGTGAFSGKPSSLVRDATAIYERIGHVSGAYELAFNWALRLESECQNQRARDEFASVLAKFGERNLSNKMAPVAWRLGRLQFLLGDLSKARTNLELATRLAFELDVRSDVETMLPDLADLYLASGELARARSCLEGRDCYAEYPERAISVEDNNTSTRSALLLEGGCFQLAEDVARATMNGAEKVLPEEYEAARGMLVRALIGKAEHANPGQRKVITQELTGIVSEPGPTQAIVSEPRPAYESCRARIHRLTARARAFGYLEKLADARSNVNLAIRVSRDYGLIALELEARLARVELVRKARNGSDAESDAEYIRKHAGFALIRKRFDGPDQRPKSCETEAIPLP
jgi:tetratricopeptide (TPR) repeat protein